MAEIWDCLNIRSGFSNSNFSLFSLMSHFLIIVKKNRPKPQHLTFTRLETAVLFNDAGNQLQIFLLDSYVRNISLFSPIGSHTRCSQQQIYFHC